MEPGQVYLWEFPRIQSFEEIDAIKARIAAAFAISQEAGEQAERKKENLFFDRRSAVVLSVLGRNITLGMCTTQDYSGKGGVIIEPADYIVQVTTKTLYFRPERILTDHSDYMLKSMGTLKREKYEECLQAVRSFLGTTR